VNNNFAFFASKVVRSKEMSDKKVWFITGSSTGFGRELTDEALAQGYRVVATARKPEVLQDFVEKYSDTARAVKLDVTKPEEVRAAIAETTKEFGRIDFVVNNAGYGSMGAIEEITDEQFRRQFETNFFGAVSVTREAIPILRKQKSGHIFNFSSVGGFVSYPSAGSYCASKFALEAVSESLAGELEHHGIKVTIVEPGAFRTEFNASALDVAENLMPEIYPTTQQFLGWLKENDGTQPGDPRKAAKAIIRVAESENPPLRLLLGEDAITAVEAELEKVREDIATWRTVGVETAFEGMKAGAIGG
jgi:NAD(P)-dependent dehydrogenase (short-subunit alcohol dehydrogenase family)